MHAPLNPRFHMWNRILGFGSTKAMRQEYAAMFNCIPYDIQPTKEDIMQTLSLADLPTMCTADTIPTGSTITRVEAPYVWYVNKEKEDTMYPTCKTDTRAATANVTLNAPAAWDKAQTAQEYLLTRLQDVVYHQYAAVDKAFKVADSNHPKSLTEFMDRLKKGDYKLDKEGEKRLKKEALDAEFDDDDAFYFGHSFANYIDWRTEPFDYDGWSAARDAVSDAFNTAKDAIMVSTAEDGLKAVQAFETATFSK